MDSTVGVVDIYGFEVGILPGPWFKKHLLVVPDVMSQLLCVLLQDLGVNSFEQLCINFANEQLQHFVTKAVISQEQVSGLCAELID